MWRHAFVIGDTTASKKKNGAGQMAENECVERSPDEARRVATEVDRIADAHQDALGRDAPLFAIGSVPLQRAIAPLEAWQWADLDLRLTDVAPGDIETRIRQLGRACASLGGDFSAVRYLAQQSDARGSAAKGDGGSGDGDDDEKGKGECDLLSKTKCRLPTASSPTAAPAPVSVVNTVLGRGSLASYIPRTKEPSRVAYAVREPHVLIAPSRQWLKEARRRELVRLPPSDGSDVAAEEQATESEMRLKYVPRGWIPVDGVENGHRERSLNGTTATDETYRFARVDTGRRVSPSSPLSPPPSTSALRSIARQRKRHAEATADAHFRASAAWVAVGYAQAASATVAAVGAAAIFGASRFPTRVPSVPASYGLARCRRLALPLAAFAMSVAIAQLPMYGSGSQSAAVAHRRAGADYAHLGAEWEMLAARIAKTAAAPNTANDPAVPVAPLGRVDAHATLLLDRGRALDRLYPRAPRFFQRGIATARRRVPPPPSPASPSSAPFHPPPP